MVSRNKTLKEFWKKDVGHRKRDGSVTNIHKTQSFLVNISISQTIYKTLFKQKVYLTEIKCYSSQIVTSKFRDTRSSGIFRI